MCVFLQSIQRYLCRLLLCVFPYFTTLKEPQFVHVFFSHIQSGLMIIIDLH